MGWVKMELFSNITNKNKMKAILDNPVGKTWRDDDITDKQKSTIIKMAGILDWNCNIPDKKGPAADIIKELMAEAEKRIAITGSMGYNPEYDGSFMNDEEEGPDFNDN